MRLRVHFLYLRGTSQRMLYKKRPSKKNARHRTSAKTNPRSAAEHEKIYQALTEPIIVMESPCFSRKNAEELIFDIPKSIERIPIDWYSPAIDKAHPPKRSVAALLTREEETVLFRQYNYARMKLQSLQKLFDSQTKPSEKKVDELIHWYDIAIDRRDLIVERNLALVLAMAKRTWATGEYADLVAEGNMALIRSVNRFNCELGYKFSTYACRALTTAFNRFGRKQSKHRDNVPFEFEPNREPIHQDESISNVSPEHISALREIVRGKDLCLTTVEKEVLRYRFGLFSGQNPPKLTLEKAGKIMGISKERVRQVQIRALRKIKEAIGSQFPLDLMAG